MASRGQFMSSLGVLEATLGQRGCACGSRGGLVGSGGAPGRLLDAFGGHFGPIWETLGSLFCFWGEPRGTLLDAFLRSTKLSVPEGGSGLFRGGPKCVSTAQVQRFRWSAHRRKYNCFVIFGLRR